MDICTITDFREALRNPDLHFASIGDIIPDSSTFCRTTLFAECRALLHGQPIMLYAPISAKSLDYALRAMGAMRFTSEGDLRPLRILADEMLRPGAAGRCTIVMERLPYGETLEELLNGNCHDHLLRGLDELEQRMRHFDLSHNNLIPKSIIVDDDYRWWPIRQYYTTSNFGGDESALTALRTKIGRTQHLSDVYSDPHDEQQNNRRYHALIEGRRRRISDEGIGFEDENGDLVIACQYAWVDDFTEGRSVVISPDNRVGVIDKQGAYIIPMCYDDIVFDVQTGISEVYNGALVAHFDYTGKQLDEWQERCSNVEEEHV